ncbi:MAG TPA: MBL fold metallo-hydrolase, partial [Thermoanaerobaculia bacterium]|nr:MBL fold metallo-hydrolase [Thermoanaerobaculia bacterium]
MRLHFYGTKGYVEESSRAHSGHSAFTIESDGFRLLCDFGENRKGLLKKIRPDAIFVSHAHPDHSWGLEEGTSAPVYASAITHELTAKFPIAERVVLEPGRRVRVGPFRLTSCPVVHSVRCPCIAARLEVSGRILIYSGDIVAFDRPDEILRGAEIYVGDGSTLKGSLVRRHPSGTLIGHTTVRAQLGWLAKHSV